MNQLPPANDEFHITPQQAAMLLYTGHEEVSGIGLTMEQYFLRHDFNRDGRIDAKDRTAPDWLKLKTATALKSIYGQLLHFTRAFDSDGDQRMSEAEFRHMLQGLQAVAERYPDFPNALYTLTEIKLGSTDRKVDNARFEAGFGEILQHGLPAAPLSGGHQR